MEGQIIVLDKEKHVVAVVSNSEFIVNVEYQVIYDPKEEYQFVDCDNGMIRAVKEKTPQDVRNQEESNVFLSPQFVCGVIGIVCAVLYFYMKFRGIEQ